jgi:hypothetical protein
MKGIDMSKDPYCSKATPATRHILETVVVGNGGGLENVVLYISEGLSGCGQYEIDSPCRCSTRRTVCTRRMYCR